MPTGARGEAWLDEAERKYPVLFTNRALAEAERALGKSVLEVVDALRMRHLAIDDLARLLAIGMEYARRDSGENHKPYTRDDAFAMLDQFGFGHVAVTVFDALAAVLNYGPEAEQANPPE